MKKINAKKSTKSIILPKKTLKKKKKKSMSKKKPKKTKSLTISEDDRSILEETKIELKEILNQEIFNENNYEKRDILDFNQFEINFLNERKNSKGILNLEEFKLEMQKNFKEKLGKIYSNEKTRLNYDYSKSLDLDQYFKKIMTKEDCFKFFCF